MKYFKITGVFILAVLCHIAQGQQFLQDTLVLHDIEILSSRLKNYGTGDKVTEINTEDKKLRNHANLGQLLSRYSGVNIRSYGLSGLSTISFRGAGSNHSAVFWEGVNLQSSTNGSLDLSQVPVSFVDDVSLQFGGGSALYGSGTIGGSVQLNGRTPQFGQGFSTALHQQVGSFDQRYTGFTVTNGGKQYHLKLRVFDHQADNDFTFFNRFSGNDETLANAGIEQRGLLFEPSVKIGANGILKLKYWFQDNEVQIPKTAGQGIDSNDLQKDKFHRTVLTYQKDTPGQRIKFLTSWLNHSLTFNQASPSQTDAWISEVQMDKVLGGLWKVQWGINHTYETAQVENFGGQQPERQQTAAFASATKMFFDKLEVAISAREVFVDGDFTPFAPSVGLNYQINPRYALKSKLARSFRLPTFNDLYWVSGTDNGNPQLQPERGISMEIGQVAHFGQNENIKTELTLFSNYVDNWIQWQPNSAGNWSPVNVVEAWLRGVEFNTRYDQNISDDLKVGGRLDYTYTQATKEKIEAEGNQSESGKQLIYVPTHQATANVSIGYKNLLLSVNQVYTGEQFTTGDNNERWVLEAFQLTDLTLAYQKTIQKHEVNMALRINNLFDTAYEIRSSYPMPGRNYNLSLTYTFKNKTQHD